MDVLQDEQRAVCRKVVENPQDFSAVADWMLLAAIDALIGGHEYLAHYHMAWHEAIATNL